MNNNKVRTFNVSYLTEASKDVDKMMVCNTFGFMIEIQRVCKQNDLDPYNMAHVLVAIELLKMQVSFN